LPDGRHFLYYASRGEGEEPGEIFVGSLDQQPPRRVVESSSLAMFAAPGYLLFVRGKTLLAQPFDVDRLRLIEPAEDVGFVMDAIRLVSAELARKQAVIGFSGSPFPLACYLIEGRPSRDYAIAKAFMYREPGAWHALMEKLSTVVVRYLNAQIAAGVHVVQLFDSWVGALSPSDYVTYVQPHVARIFAAVHGAPTIHFGTGTAALLELMAAAGGDVMGVDARQSLDVAWERIGFERGFQGNLDAARLLAGWDATQEGALDVLRRAANRPGHIFNLGHGVLPETDPDLLTRLVDLVHTETAR